MSLELPQEFENQMRRRLGPEFGAFCQSLENSPPVSVRHHPAKSSLPYGERVPWCTSGWYLPERPLFTLDPKFHAGAYYVQEASSMFLEQAVIQSVDLRKDLNVLDLCAAPGGKSTHLLSLLSPQSLLISNEVIRSRASILSENLKKWGCDNVIVTQSDPSGFGRMPGFFDLIVLDAPCSGEGLFRREPETMNEWSLQHIGHCSMRQKRILGEVWPSLKPGGVLIYSTCTYNEKENLQNLEWLHSHAGAESVKLSLRADWNLAALDAGPCTGYQFYPHRNRGEGFFIAVVRKTGEAKVARSRARDTLEFALPAQTGEVSRWISGGTSQCYFLHNQTIQMLPGSKQNELQFVLNHLNVILAGTPVATIARNKLIPDHALALSVRLLKHSFSVIPLTEAQAISYLRKDHVALSLDQPGFSLITYGGLGLGWVNILPNRYNNLYPSSWRIRMEH